MSQWILSEFYQNWGVWKEDLDALKERIKTFPSFKGSIKDKDSFKSYLLFERETVLVLYKLYPFAHLSSDLDLKDMDLSGKNQEVMLLFAQFQQATSWYSPEVLALGEEKVMGFIDSDADLEEYRFPIKKLFHQQKHVLDEENERILSNFQNVLSVPSSLYNSLAIADSDDETITLSNGKSQTVTLGNYRSLVADSENAEDRRLIFEAVFKRYKTHKNTFASLYNMVLQSNAAKYKSRKYESVLESFLFHNNIPTTVFTTLIDVAKANTDPLKRYIELRKKHLNIDDYKTYDRYLKLATSNQKFSYEEGRDLFFDSLDGLEEGFVNKQKEALADGFVDAFEKPGKRSGAYSSGVYGHHPYILLNHDNTLDSVFTLAHEAGHSAHTMFANETQPLATANYTIFVAEIASTFNEQILLDYLLKNTQDTQEKIALIEESINGILATFYRQTLFAAYEAEANELVAQGNPITADSLSAIMINLYKQFYDLDITKENGKEYVWAYIPHLFHTPFYVYQYATSYSASLKIYENVKQGIPGAMDGLIELLKSGGSEYPVDQARKAGADLEKRETFEAVVNRLNELLDVLETLLEEVV